tara:strand:+ start:1137 stop:1934 length:798 start_codon:yes stop_codon:yes gene_type:complete
VIEFNQKQVITKQSNLDFSGAKISEIKNVNGIINIIFKEENTKEQELDLWVVQLTNDQFTQVRREIDIQPISPEQLKAIHAKEALKKKEELVIKGQQGHKGHSEIEDTPSPEEEIVEEEKPSKPKGFRPIPSPVVEKLPTIEADPLNWKNKEPEREARRMRSRLDDNRIVNLLNFVFKFHAKMIKTNGYSQSHRDKNKNLSHFLKTIVPNAFSLPYSSCQGIYTAKSYYTITSTYRQQWVDLCCYFIEKGYKDNLPGYLVKHYVG